MITQEYLKTILNYNQDTGIFTWVKNNKIAGTIDYSKYHRIVINKKYYRGHRLAWLYVYGVWPTNQIDHINGIRNDNRIENLRDVTNRENASNKVGHRSGRLVGCYYFKRDKKWYSQIQINGKIIYLGSYNTEIEAHSSYIKYLNNTGG